MAQKSLPKPFGRTARGFSLWVRNPATPARNTTGSLQERPPDSAENSVGRFSQNLRRVSSMGPTTKTQ